MNDTGQAHDGDSLPPSTALLLVAVMPSPRDLEIARVLGWYRIPFRFAPKIVQVDYLAFYQPSSFGKAHANRIEYFSEVRGVELALRREIIRDEPDHPRADEEYYKLSLGKLERLARPIPADKWKRITFLYTTGELFASARIINDLVVRSEERKILWHSLCEKARASELYHSDSAPDFELTPDVLMMLGEIAFNQKAQG
ncbi:MAG: hypothetical protein PWQ55_2029 [Chloroflexota bacterium]|nr:hypothetical protein [Chloroflexota bacterium]